MTARLFRRPALVLAVLLAGLGVSADAQTRGERMQFSAVAFDIEVSQAYQLRIIIDRWTPDAENQKLLETLMKDGQRAFERALNDTRSVGRIRTLDGIGWSLHLARDTRGKDGGHNILLVTDRPMSFAESWSNSRSTDYPFTIIELNLNEDYEGTGTIALATKLIPDPVNKILVLENYETQRIQLKQVKRED
jgi:hypothetical protein